MKTKERLRPRLADSYVAINDKNIGLADDLVVVFFSDDGSLSHYGPIDIQMVDYKQHKTQKRYTIASIIIAISEI